MKKWLPFLIGCLGISIFVCIAAVIVVMIAGGELSTELVAVGQPDTMPTPVPPAPPFEEIRRNHEAMVSGNMTEAKWKNFKDPIKGTQAFQWSGRIYDVERNEFSGKYWVRIDMDTTDGLINISEVSFVVPEETALSYEKGQQLTFSGRIDDIIDIMGTLEITIEDVTLH